MNNFFKGTILTLFIVFVGLYYLSNAGVIDYKAKNKTILTEEQIRAFEEDVKNNVEIDIKKYIDNKEEQYNNGISKTTLKVSNSIGEAVSSILNFVFSKMEDVMNG